jgi:hypothetical protein
MGKKISLVGKLEGKRPYGRLGHRWEDRIGRDLVQTVGVCRCFTWFRIGTSARLP